MTVWLLRLLPTGSCRFHKGKKNCGSEGNLSLTEVLLKRMTNAIKEYSKSES